MRTTIIDIDQPRTALIRWGAIVAGAVWGLGVMAVLSALWLALAFPSGVDVIRDELEWFIAGSGAFSLFVAGLVAGALTDARGAGSGLLHGMTAWGALLIAALIFGLPSIFGLFSAGELRTIESGDLVGPGASDTMWATFATLVVGAVVAAIGGMIGGAPRRRSTRRPSGALPGSERTDATRGDVVDAEGDRVPPPPEPAGSPASDEDRVMVRRTADGSYVDQDGRRYVAEPAGSRSAVDD
jgi:hypothetical protein